jgi:hypothetical protein
MNCKCIVLESRIQNSFGYLLLHLIFLIFSDIQGDQDTQVDQVLKNNVILHLITLIFF